MKKKCQVVILSTKKVPVIGQLMQFHSNQYSENNYKKGFLTTCKNIGHDIERWHGHHLYFTTDERIEESDWCIYKGKYIVQIKETDPSGFICSDNCKPLLHEVKKIVASTDESLGLSRPSNEFLKAYCEAYNSNPITEVNVEYEIFIYNPFTEKEYCNGDNISYEDCNKGQKLKVAPDNTITISKVEERMFTLEELTKLVRLAWFEGIERGSCKCQFQDKYEKEFIVEWLRNKLK